jgi:hypothetical protein
MCHFALKTYLIEIILTYGINLVAIWKKPYYYRTRTYPYEREK